MTSKTSPPISPQHAARVCPLSAVRSGVTLSVAAPAGEGSTGAVRFVGEYPHLKGETTERDEVGRTVEVKFVAKFKVIYWADHAVKEIKVLRLERLRRG